MRKYFSFLLLLAGSFLFQGCASLGKLEAPSVNIADIRLQGATLLEQRYQLQLRIQNPNPVELPIDGLAYEVEINSKPFAKGVSNQPVTVPRYGSALLEVEGTSTLFDIIRQVAGLQKGQGGPVRYRLKGKLGLQGGTQVPFDYQGEIEVPDMPAGQPAGAH